MFFKRYKKLLFIAGILAAVLTINLGLNGNLLSGLPLWVW
ncbi:hypothetical protein BJV85_003812 [Clostridium acetobutylicum]|nr:hypothetical protein [Clostridium acetobutylicum]NOW16474.1 hypothetical protein [Clostridium acetobutylicum]NRY58743.1 hypothetical protein [Clostridium acetobutylicum]NSA94865.1 hypothetical protein [Clostridium acetobutylicum]NYC96103.1 hypothetical protein [Clostridium acetobutylicum]